MLCVCVCVCVFSSFLLLLLMVPVVIPMVVARRVLPRLAQADDDSAVLPRAVEDPEPCHKACKDAKVLVR